LPWLRPVLIETAQGFIYPKYQVEGDNLFHTGTGNIRGKTGNENRQYPTIEHWNGYIREETSGPEDRKVMYTGMPSRSFSPHQLQHHSLIFPLNNDQSTLLHLSLD
jgi:hypothetical protein